MAETKFTPGPWFFSRPGYGIFRIYGPDGQGDDSGLVATAEVRRTTETRNANAHLIAAAPELVDALEPLARIPIGGEIEDDRELVLYQNMGRAITVGDVLDARAALAKARGQS